MSKTVKNDNDKTTDVLTIPVDMDFKDVLKLDSEGKRLTWDEGDFPKYTPKQVSKLGAYNHASYLNSFFLKQSADRPTDDVQTPNLKISGRLANPTDKLNVDYPEGYRDKWHTYWERADRVNDSLRQGYKVVNTNKDEDKGLQAFYSSADGTIRVGTTGSDELILMKEPVEVNDERIRQVGERSKASTGDVERRGEDDIRSAGGVPYNPSRDRRKDESLKWHVTEPSG